MNRLATLVIAESIACAQSAAAEDVGIAYDASRSMWGQIDGTSKIEIARDVMAGLMNGWDADTNLGAPLVALGPMDKAGFIDAIIAIVPLGRTSLTEAVRQAAQLSTRSAIWKSPARRSWDGPWRR